ncbi:MAG: protease inhibitor I42 family protein [Acidimicrobiia bacterium]|jgi:inhibitor of cysteine peptidase
MQRRCRWVLVVAVVVLVSLVALAGCGGSDDDSGGGSSKGGSGGESVTGVYTAGQSITVQQGDTFVIALDANPSTGYSWSAAANPNATYVSSKQVQGKDLPGAPGTQRLTFRATAAGSSTLVLNYSRPFETGVPPVQTESFSLTVK